MIQIDKWKSALAACAALSLIACENDGGATAEPKTADVTAGADHAADHAAAASAAVANASRPDGEAADDEMRKPAGVLAFAKIEPGMTVFEMEAGNGYYTELLSILVGADGEVIMQNPQSFDTFLGDAVEVRLVDSRLPNVRASRTNFDALDAADGSVDVVTWILGPHELYFVPASGESLGEVETTYAEIVRILKPGGVFVVLDHVATPGSPETTGDTLHRIDPAIVKGLTEAAGLVLVEESDILRNPDDKYDMGVFDPAVRRKTDRFLLKYKKPE